MTDSLPPFGYFSLPAFGIAPFGCPSNCDDGAFLVNVPSFNYNGESHSSVIFSVNGTLEVGTASGSAASAEWYIAVLNAGPAQFTVYEWNNIPRFGDNSGDPAL